MVLVISVCTLVQFPAGLSGPPMMPDYSFRDQLEEDLIHLITVKESTNADILIVPVLANSRALQGGHGLLTFVFPVLFSP